MIEVEQDVQAFAFVTRTGHVLPETIQNTADLADRMARKALGWSAKEHGSVERVYVRVMVIRDRGM